MRMVDERDGTLSNTMTKSRLGKVSGKRLENQIKRRENVLSVARTLLSERGYKGLTIRALADACGISFKTLYHYFGDKNALLREAIEAQYVELYARISAEERYTGFDRFMFIADTLMGAVMSNTAYAKELIRLRDLYSVGYEAVRLDAYRHAFQEMLAQRELQGWVNIDFVTRFLIRQLSVPMLMWAAGRLEDQILPLYFKLTVCTFLEGLTEGRTYECVVTMKRRLHAELASAMSA